MLGVIWGWVMGGQNYIIDFVPLLVLSQIYQYLSIYDYQNLSTLKGVYQNVSTLRGVAEQCSWKVTPRMSAISWMSVAVAIWRAALNKTKFHWIFRE